MTLQLAHHTWAFISLLFQCLLLLPHCICLRRIFISLSLLFLITSKFSICLALGRSSCTIDVSRPTVWNPSPVLYHFITAKVIPRGWCVKQFPWMCTVGLLLPVQCSCTYLFWGKPAEKYGSFTAEKYGSFTAQQSSGRSWGFDYLLLLLRQCRFLGNCWDKTGH